MVHYRLKIKKKSRETPKKVISARVTEAEHDAISARARFLNVNLGDFVRHACIHYHPKPDALEKFKPMVEEGEIYGEEDWTDDL